jgi:hypothetical protein
MDPRPVLNALGRVNFSQVSNRSAGMRTQSRVVGAMPRRALRKGGACRISVMAETNPNEHETICSYALRGAQEYRRYNPELYAKHDALAEKVLRDYRIDETVFTSGIINKNAALPYHFDAGNFKNVWSCMLTLKDSIEGGYLAVPEYDLLFRLRHNSIFMFDGQGLLHGVTPIKLMSREAVRYTIVFYSLERMWDCMAVDDEVIRAQGKQTEKARKRVKYFKGELDESELGF